MTPRLLFVHAHPDDETLNNGATIAYYAAMGADVTVLTCTLGEEGEIIGDQWAHLGVDAADQLGGYRIGELTAALAHLGVKQPRFLGGAGYWRDSGMAGTSSRSRRRFIDGDIDIAIGQVVEVIAELRPHVVVTYDPDGGYGHPDHIHAHRITTEAVRLVADSWQVPKFYWTVVSASALRTGIAALSVSDALPECIWPPDGLSFGFADEQITTVIDAPQYGAVKAAALAEHATQVTVGPTGRAFALSNKLLLPIMAQEHYVLTGLGGVLERQEWETDLLAGLVIE